MLNLNGGLVILLTTLNGLNGGVSSLEMFTRNEEYVPMLRVALDFRVVNFATDETLSVEDGVFRVRVVCILRAVGDTRRNSWTGIRGMVSPSELTSADPNILLPPPSSAFDKSYKVRSGAKEPSHRSSIMPGRQNTGRDSCQGGWSSELREDRAG